MRASSRSIAPLGLMLACWAAVLAGASLAVEDAWHQVRPVATSPSAVALALAPIFSIAAGIYSLVFGGALLGLTWLAIPATARRTLPWITGLWGLVTFIALCGGLGPGFAMPAVGLLLAVVAWFLVAEVVRVIITALVVELSAPTQASHHAEADV